MRFSGKTVFVAGGTTGINLGIATAFARDGARVAVMSRKQFNVDAALKTLQATGSEALGFVADVRNYDAVSQVLSRLKQSWGDLDVVISGAAGNFLAPASQMSSNAFKAVIDIDLLGSFNVVRAAFEHLRKPGATIINITAPQAWSPTPLQVHACAAKAGVDLMTRTLAMEWGPAGVRVNAISPGPIAGTEGLQRLVTAEAQENLLSAVPCGRLGRVEDIAATALWLCSEEASYITGVILPVDGGWSLGGTSSMHAPLRKASHISGAA